MLPGVCHVRIELTVPTTWTECQHTEGGCTVVAWGCNGFDCGQCTVPAGLIRVTAIAAGEFDSLALKSDGAVGAWGCSNGTDFGQCAVPPL
jgi:hypothetical protein